MARLLKIVMEGTVDEVIVLVEDSYDEAVVMDEYGAFLDGDGVVSIEEDLDVDEVNLEKFFSLGRAYIG